MQFHRTYDLSCLTDETEQRNLRNAIEAVNLSCTQHENAWDYVASYQFLEDISTLLDRSNNTMRSILRHMEFAKHTAYTFTWTIHTLVAITHDYNSWRSTKQHDVSSKENEIFLVNSWRQNMLIPYYSSVSGGGSRASIGPLLDEFLALRETLKMPKLADSLREELEIHLGYSLKERLETMEEVIKVNSSPRLVAYRNELLRREKNKMSEEEYHSKLISEQSNILKAAIESRNPIALRAALSPGWDSPRLQVSYEYQEAQRLLEELT